MAASDPMRNLGVRLTEAGGELRVWRANATSIELCVFDAGDASWVSDRVPLVRGEGDVWSVVTPLLAAGTSYALSVDGPEGPTHAFDPERFLLDPYARGLARTSDGA